MKRRFILHVTILAAFLITSSCSYKTYNPMSVTYKVNAVTAVDLEEDGYLFSTGNDEVYILYSLSSLDSDGKIIERRNNPPQEYETFSRKGDTKSGYAPLSVYVPAMGKVIFSVQLIEDDEYTWGRKILDDADTVLDIAKFASKVSKGRQTTQMLRAARSLRLASRIIGVAGLALTIVDIIDTDDELMAVCFVLDENQLQNLLSQKYITRDYSKRGSNWGDIFEYNVNFSVSAQPAKGNTIKVRQRFVAKAPNVILHYSPIVLSQPLNNFWLNYPDKLFETRPASGEHEWSDGLYNKKMWTSLGIGLAPPIKLSRILLLKLYGQGSYNRSPYLLNFKDYEYSIGNSYYTNNSGTPVQVTVSGIEFDITQFGSSIYLKLIGEDFFWDIGGGLHFCNAKIMFKDIAFDKSDVEFTYDQSKKVIKPTRLPFGYTKVGIGSLDKKTKKGMLFSAGLMASQPSYDFINDFDLYYKNMGNSELIPASNNKWRLGYVFGLDVVF